MDSRQMAKQRAIGGALIMPPGVFLGVVWGVVKEPVVLYGTIFVLFVGAALLVSGIVSLRRLGPAPSPRPDLTSSALHDGASSFGRAPIGGPGELAGKLIESVKPIRKDQDYYFRLVAALLAVAFFFAAGAFVASKELSEFQGFLGRSGNVFYYSSKNEVLGSMGQALVSAVLAAAALGAAMVVAVRGWHSGFSALIGVIVTDAIAFGIFAGFMGNGVIQLFLLGTLRLRVLWWFLMPVAYAASLWGALYFAKEGRASAKDFG